MKKENKLIVAAVVLPLLVGAFFSQTSSYKLNLMHFIVLTTLIVAYNMMLYLQRADWEYRRTVLQYSAMGFVTIGLIQGSVRCARPGRSARLSNCGWERLWRLFCWRGFCCC